MHHDNIASSDNLFDELLVDYFDWIDHSDSRDVDQFLRSVPHWSRKTELVESLKEYVRQTNEVEELVSSTAYNWLECDSRSATGALDEGPPFDASSLPTGFGDYELLKELGRGGMGVVYRARQVSLDRIVCVKMILQGCLAKQEDVERFWGEAKAMAALRHPNIVAVFEVGQRAGQYYFSMEYVAGKSLAELVQSAPLDARLAARIVRDVSSAISYAHHQRVLHRDLKPSNIIVDQQDRPHVTDFGLARQIDTGALTTTGSLAGTPSYMAPEHTYGDRSASTACDIYGLGTLLYESFTGRPPFQGDTPLDTLLQVRTTDAVRPSLLNARVPQDLETICQKCMAKAPADRYATAAELVDELERFLRGEPIKARPIGIVTRLARWCRRNPFPVALAATVVLAALFVVAAIFRSYLVTSAALANLSSTHSQLQTEQAKNEELIKALRDERDRVADHLYLSRIRRLNQAVNHGDILEADSLLKDLIPTRGETGRRGWEWYYLNALTRQYLNSFDLSDGVKSLVVIELDGQQRVATIGQQELRIYSAASAETFSGFSVANASGILAGNRHNDTIAIGLTDGSVELRESPYGESSAMLQSDETWAAARCLAWSPRGDRIAAGYPDGFVVVWELATEQVALRRRIHTDGINALSWNDDGTWLASASDDATVRVCRAEDGQSVATLGRFRDWVNDVAFRPDGRRLVAVSQSGELQVWQLHKVEEAEIVAQQLFGRSSAHGDALSCVVWDSTGMQMATGGASSTITLWNAETGQLQRQLHGHRDAVTSLAWPDEELLLSSSIDGTIKSWSTAVAPDGGRIAPTAAPVRYVKWNPLNQLVAWRDVEGLTSVWNHDTRTRIHQFPETAFGATAVAWHPRGNQLALAREDSVLVFGIPREDQRLQLGTGGLVWTIRWSPDGRYLATGGSGTGILLWDTDRGEQVGSLQGHAGSVRTFCWTSNEHLCSADETATIRLWNVKDHIVEDLRKIDTALITSLAPSRDGTRLSVTTEEGPIYGLHLPTMQVRLILHGHQGTTWASIWISGDARLASAGQDGTVRLWDVASGEEALRLQAHESAVWSLDISPDGLVLVSAGADGEVRFWDASDRTVR